jgi:hypothetical protein
MVKTIPLDKLISYLFEDAPSKSYFKKRFGRRVPVTVRNMSSIADYVVWEGLAEEVLDKKGYEKFIDAHNQVILDYVDEYARMLPCYHVNMNELWRKLIHKRNVGYAKAFVEAYNNTMREVRSNELANHA